MSQVVLVGLFVLINTIIVYFPYYDHQVMGFSETQSQTRLSNWTPAEPPVHETIIAVPLWLPLLLREPKCDVTKNSNMSYNSPYHLCYCTLKRERVRDTSYLLTLLNRGNCGSTSYRFVCYGIPDFSKIECNKGRENNTTNPTKSKQTTTKKSAKLQSQPVHLTVQKTTRHCGSNAECHHLWIRNWAFSWALFSNILVQYERKDLLRKSSDNTKLLVKC